LETLPTGMLDCFSFGIRIQLDSLLRLVLEPWTRGLLVHIVTSVK